MAKISKQSVIHVLGFTDYLNTVLLKNRIDLVGKLVKLSEDELLDMPEIGRHKVEIIKKGLTKHGFSLRS